MHCIIPFETKIKFDYPVKEICSISLEHEITKNDDELLGNFFISGTCKEHELSVNTTDYNFTLPFSVAYTNKIDLSTLEFNIENFTYSLDNNELQVNIDYAITAQDVEESNRLDPYELITDNDQNNNLEDNSKVEMNREEKDESSNEIVETPQETYQNMVTGIQMTDDYTIYHVHFLSESDTLDSLCQTYKISQDDLLMINNIESIDGLEKILIPLKYE